MAFLPCNSHEIQPSEDCDGWSGKLVGKILLGNDEATTLSESESVREKELPLPHRILAPNTMSTCDFVPNRLNVSIDRTRRIKGVKYG
ncbi:hypothetical protein BDF14DRAFT_1807591 [Spinellus fusiger]|nr:hypothetical protein BDF14DRAFT_1807591 [Spinellus fusiger]